MNGSIAVEATSLIVVGTENPGRIAAVNISKRAKRPRLASRTWGTRHTANGRLLDFATSVEQMQFFAGLETDGASRRYGNFRTGTRVTSNPCFPGFHAEYAKAAQFNSVSGGERIFHAGEDGIHSGLGFHSRQPGAFRNFMNYILFDQMSVPPSGCWLQADPVSPC